MCLWLFYLLLFCVVLCAAEKTPNILPSRLVTGIAYINVVSPFGMLVSAVAILQGSSIRVRKLAASVFGGLIRNKTTHCMHQKRPVKEA